MLLYHFGSGQNFPLSSFVEVLLEFCLMQLTHLMPTTITFLAVFMHLCETFLGWRP